MYVCMYVYKFIFITVYYKTKLNNVTEFQNTYI